MSAQMSNHISQLRRQIEELNCHMNIRRTMVSDASQQLMQFVVENEQRDYLVVKPPDNPFKPKSTCPLL
ncbi:guanine nucleotide-binding protein G(I)/G(S)/G(O) subunit gamma-12-like [Styela clava]